MVSASKHRIEEFLFKFKKKFIERNDEYTFTIDIVGQKELNKLIAEHVDDKDVKNLTQQYALIIKLVKIIFDKSLDELNDFIRNLNNNENEIDIEDLDSFIKEIISSSCFYMSNYDLNYICVDRNRLGIFITFDWYMNENQYNFLR